MAIELVIEPGRVVEWESFRRFPRRSIAIDGFCKGAPRFSSSRLVLNINHHEDVDRIATRSSCAQSLHLLKMGLYDSFCKAGRPSATLYANDCDQDVVLATYILMHPKHVDRPRLKMLAQLEDVLDMSAGLYPIKKRWHLLKMLTWITEPYALARANGTLYGMAGGEQRALIDCMHRRTQRTLFGRGKELQPDLKFEVVEDYGGWQLVHETGVHARIGLGQSGIKAFVSYRNTAPGHGHCIIARRSKFIRSFPLSLIRPRLDTAEREAGGSGSWGGAMDTVIGSPRGQGTVLPVTRIVEIVRECCAMRAAEDAAS